MTIRFDVLRSNFTRYRKALDSIAANPIFRFAQAVFVNSTLQIRQNGRGPIDGGSFTRPNWKERNASLWPYLNSRLHLTWSCENGRYGTEPPPIVFLESMPLMSHADIDGGRVSSFTLSAPSLPFTFPLLSAAVCDTGLTHALAVAGMALATADNGIGVAGVV